MKAVFFILNDSGKLTDLLGTLNNAGIKGTTIYSAKGMCSELSQIDDFSQNFGIFRRLVEGSKQEHKVLMFVIEEDKIPHLVETIEGVVGNLEGEGTGLLFTMPIDYVKGLKY